MPLVERVCKECDAQIQVLQRWLDFKPGRGQFCSSSCHQAYRKRQSEQVVACLECGKEFQTRQHLINRGEAKFCSQSCAARYNNRERGEPLSKEVLEELYYSANLSMAEIAEHFGCSANKVAYWMDRHGIPRRDLSEAVYLKRNPDGDPFSIRELISNEDRELFQLGVGLYIGEGSKSRRREVALSNTDPRVIRAFLRFLQDVCAVDKSNIFAWINVFDDVDLEEVQAYWERVTELPRSQFYKATVRSSKGGTYTRKSSYGTITISVSNTKLKSIIQRWCEQALEKYG